MTKLANVPLKEDIEILTSEELDLEDPIVTSEELERILEEQELERLFSEEELERLLEELDLEELERLFSRDPFSENPFTEQELERLLGEAPFPILSMTSNRSSSPFFLEEYETCQL